MLALCWLFFFRISFLNVSSHLLKDGLFILFIMTVFVLRSMVSMTTTVATHRYKDSHSSFMEL